jgi:hypothetical protein
VGKLVTVVEKENSTGEEGRPTSHVNYKQTWKLAGAAAQPSN